MPLSISSSDARSWVKSWGIALLTAILLLSALEVFWRIKGHIPSIVDDQRLWSMERNEVGKAEKEIVLLGSSRMQTDISISTLRDLAPDSKIINLSADGTCANAVLRDLAEDKSFKGIVIVETTSECLMFGDEPGLSQQFYIDYYHKIFNLNVIVNRIIATYLQKNLTVIDPYLNLIKVAGDKIVKKKWRMPNYLTTYKDRTRSADYTKLDLERHKSMRLSKVDNNYRQLSPRISTQLLMQKTEDINSYIKKINNRGGQVIFFRFPVSDEHWDIDEKYFPRSSYWDNLSSVTEAKVIHFKNIDSINKLQCPDTSHLDAKDTKTFTMIVFNAIANRKLN